MWIKNRVVLRATGIHLKQLKHFLELYDCNIVAYQKREKQKETDF